MGACLGGCHPEPLAVSLTQPLLWVLASSSGWYKLAAPIQLHGQVGERLPEERQVNFQKPCISLAQIRSHALFGTNHFKGCESYLRLIRPTPNAGGNLTFSEAHDS